MVNMTLSIPSELKTKMDQFSEINWSAVARIAFEEKLKDLDFLRKFKSDSTLTEEDALKLGKELNERLSKRRLKNETSD
jgi:hypothetical protein